MSKNKKQASWGLQKLCDYAKLFSIDDIELSDNLTMRDSKEIFEKRILEEIHPYAITQELVNGKYYWRTTLPDSSSKSGRVIRRRESYDDLCQLVIEYYVNKKYLDMTMDSLFDKWLIFRRDETSAKPGTIRSDKSNYTIHCRSIIINDIPFGDWKVSDITAQTLYYLFRTLTKDRTYTHDKISNIRSTLSGMFSYAVEQDIVQSNPVKEIDLRRFDYKPKRSSNNNVFTIEDAQKLLTHLESFNEPYALAIRLFFNMFVRIGEIAGLLWEDVDLEQRTISICHQLTYEPILNDDLTFSDKKMVLEDYLKGCTSQGYRDQYITDEALEILKSAKEINPNGRFVFMPNGNPIITLTFDKHLKKYCEEVGIPYRSSHKIRFYAASVAYDGTNLTAISRMMGHSQIGTTMHYLRDVMQQDDYSEVFKNLGHQK